MPIEILRLKPHQRIMTMSSNVVTKTLSTVTRVLMHRMTFREYERIEDLVPGTSLKVDRCEQY